MPFANPQKNEWFSVAVSAAIYAGKEILEIYNSADFGVEKKSDHSPLTKADIAADKMIGHWLGPSGVPMLSEEDLQHVSFDERKNWDLCWIIDPLDGTKEFIKRNGEFTVNIALVENGKPIFGVVYAPALGDFYYGEVGVGAWKVKIPDPFSLNIDFRSQMDLPLQTLPSKFTIAGSRSHSSPETEEYIRVMKTKHGEVDFIASGSSLKFCLVAEGKANAYPRFAPTMEWDTAAGHAILVAAGGTVVTWPEQLPLVYNREELLNPWFLAAR